MRTWSDLIHFYDIKIQNREKSKSDWKDGIQFRRDSDWLGLSNCIPLQLLLLIVTKLRRWLRTTLNQLVRSRISDHRILAHHTITWQKTRPSRALRLKFSMSIFNVLRSSPQYLHDLNSSDLVSWLTICTLLIKILCVYRIPLSLIHVESNFGIPSSTRGTLDKTWHFD